MAIHTVNAANLVALQQTLRSNMKGCVASNFLTISQVGRPNIQIVSARNFLSQLGQTTNVRRSITNVSILQSLGLVGRAARVKEAFVFQWLPLFQVARPVDYFSVHQTLSLSQLAIGHTAKGNFSTLTLTQTAVAQFVRGRTVTQTLTLASSATAFLLKPCFVPQTYTLTQVPVLVLTYGSLSVTLPSPQFDNSDRIELTRINRRSRGGDLIIYRDNIWPKTETLVFKFTYLKPEIRAAFRYFLQQALGKDITLVDHESRTWTGVITTPASDMMHSGVHNREVSFEFIGELQ